MKTKIALGLLMIVGLPDIVAQAASPQDDLAYAQRLLESVANSHQLRGKQNTNLEIALNKIDMAINALNSVPTEKICTCTTDINNNATVFIDDTRVRGFGTDKFPAPSKAAVGYMSALENQGQCRVITDACGHL